MHPILKTLENYGEIGKLYQGNGIVEILLGPSPGGATSSSCGSGGGHGGYGGGSSSGRFGGKPYGSTFFPLDLGSKGGNGGSQGMILTVSLRKFHFYMIYKQR